MRNTKTGVAATQVKPEVRTWHAFEGASEEVVHNKRFFFAWKDGCLMGTYSMLGEAMESLEGRERLKTQ